MRCKALLLAAALAFPICSTSCGIADTIKRVNNFVEKNEPTIQTLVDSVAKILPVIAELPKILEGVTATIAELQKAWVAIDVNKDGDRTPEEIFKWATGGGLATAFGTIIAIWRRRNRMEAELKERNAESDERKTRHELETAAKIARLEDRLPSPPI